MPPILSATTNIAAIANMILVHLVRLFLRLANDTTLFLGKYFSRGWAAKNLAGRFDKH